MSEELDLWRLAAGLGLFLFGMHQLEQALTQLAGRSFKVFLRQYTAQPVRGVLAGALTTAALQFYLYQNILCLFHVCVLELQLKSQVHLMYCVNYIQKF